MLKFQSASKLSFLRFEFSNLEKNIAKDGRLSESTVRNKFNCFLGEELRGLLRYD